MIKQRARVLIRKIRHHCGEICTHPTCAVHETSPDRHVPRALRLAETQVNPAPQLGVAVCTTNKICYGERYLMVMRNRRRGGLRSRLSQLQLTITHRSRRGDAYLSSIKVEVLPASSKMGTPLPLLWNFRAVVQLPGLEFF
jgi:hypothetical protein